MDKEDGERRRKTPKAGRCWIKKETGESEGRMEKAIEGRMRPKYRGVSIQNLSQKNRFSSGLPIAVGAIFTRTPATSINFATDSHSRTCAGRQTRHSVVCSCFPRPPRLQSSSVVIICKDYIVCM